jgi:membrane-associated protease RseP (regulator of RpoE activity)
MTAKAQGWRSAATLLTLGTVIVLTLFLALRPLQVESPASGGARATLRLDNALGATIEPVGAAMARQDGLPSNEGYLVVTSVASKGPAASAGLHVGDVIERIDGKPANRVTAASLASATPVSVWRGGRTIIVNVQFATAARS